MNLTRIEFIELTLFWKQLSTTINNNIPAGYGEEAVADATEQLDTIKVKLRSNLGQKW